MSTTHTVTLLFLPMHRFETQKVCIPYPITLWILYRPNYNFCLSTSLKSKIPMTKNHKTLGQDKQKQRQTTNMSGINNPHKLSNPSHASSLKLRKSEIPYSNKHNIFALPSYHTVQPTLNTMLALDNTSFKSQIPPH